MENLPIEIVYEILEFSGHGKLRCGFVNWDNTIKPCKFIFSLPKRKLNIIPIVKTNMESYVRLPITKTKRIDIVVSPSNIPRQWKYQILVCEIQFVSKISRYSHLIPSREVIYTEYI